MLAILVCTDTTIPRGDTYDYPICSDKRSCRDTWDTYDYSERWDAAAEYSDACDEYTCGRLPESRDADAAAASADLDLQNLSIS